MKKLLQVLINSNTYKRYFRNEILLMEVKSLFERAVEDSKTLSSRPSNETLLQLYSLYKQSTEGDVSEDAAPTNPFDFVAKAKYEAWLALKGKPITEAQKEYINLINNLKG